MQGLSRSQRPDFYLQLWWCLSSDPGYLLTLPAQMKSKKQKKPLLVSHLNVFLCHGFAVWLAFGAIWPLTSQLCPYTENPAFLDAQGWLLDKALTGLAQVTTPWRMSHSVHGAEEWLPFKRAGPRHLQSRHSLPVSPFWTFPSTHIGHSSLSRYYSMFRHLVDKIHSGIPKESWVKWHFINHIEMSTGRGEGHRLLSFSKWFRMSS